MSQYKGRYRLERPDKLLKGLLIAVIVILILVIIGKRKGKKVQNEESTAESSEVQTTGIDTFSTNATDDYMQGTLRNVSTIGLDTVNSQLSVYMGAILLSDLENVPTSMSNYMYGSDDPLAGYNPENYRYIVGINPSRGGADKGYSVDTAVEKTITLSVAEYLITYLNEHNDGYYFFLTRESDTTKTDGARLNTAESYSCDMLITLCCNASEEELGGTIGSSFSLEDYLTEEAIELLTDEEDPEDVKVDMTDEEKERDELSAKLAESLMEACADGSGMWYRFVETEDSTMVHTDYISCIVYMGYLTYDFDREIIQDKLNQQNAAEAMGEAILKFLEEEAPVREPAETLTNTDTVDNYDPAQVYNGGREDSDSSGSSDSSDSD